MCASAKVGSSVTSPVVFDDGLIVSPHVLVEQAQIIVPGRKSGLNPQRLLVLRDRPVILLLAVQRQRGILVRLSVLWNSKPAPLWPHSAHLRNQPACRE